MSEIDTELTGTTVATDDGAQEYLTPYVAFHKTIVDSQMMEDSLVGMLIDHDLDRHK